MTTRKGRERIPRELHAEACAQGRLFYLDPETGHQVLTEVAHSRRGHCCGSGCRHCPYGHEKVPEDRREFLRTRGAGSG